MQTAAVRHTCTYCTCTHKWTCTQATNKCAYLTRTCKMYVSGHAQTFRTRINTYMHQVTFIAIHSHTQTNHLQLWALDLTNPVCAREQWDVCSRYELGVCAVRLCQHLQYYSSCLLLCKGCVHSTGSRISTSIKHRFFTKRRHIQY